MASTWSRPRGTASRISRVPTAPEMPVPWAWGKAGGIYNVLRSVHKAATQFFMRGREKKLKRKEVSFMDRNIFVESEQKRVQSGKECNGRETSTRGQLGGQRRGHNAASPQLQGCRGEGSDGADMSCPAVKPPPPCFQEITPGPQGKCWSVQDYLVL